MRREAPLLLRQLFDAPSSTYSYLLADRVGGEALLIDPVFEQHPRDLALIRELDLRLLAVIDTHCHADHVTGAWLMREATGCRIAISTRYGDAIKGADWRLDHGERIVFGARHLEVRATPGHTDGCLSLVLDDQSAVFTGDCLLIRAAGRCDFQQGNAATMFHSVTKQLFTLPDACQMFPAHDYAGRTASSIGEERAHNPRLGGHADLRDFVGTMDNLHLPHPKQIAQALPANQRSGRPEDGRYPQPAAWGPVRQSYAGVLEIEPEWVAEHLDELTVVDVRQPEEHLEALSRIAGALPIPLSELKSRLGELPQGRPIVTVCHAGMRSAQATVLLRQAGLTHVANLRGGMLLWRQLGLAVA